MAPIGESGCAQISSTSRARRCAVLPDSISAAITGVIRAATVSGAEAEIGEADDLALVHRDAAENLREIFAERDADRGLLDFAEAAGRQHAVGIGDELAHGLHIGREPGEAVRGALLALKDALDDAPIDRHARRGRRGWHRPAALPASAPPPAP